jgi:hypothetical protein
MQVTLSYMDIPCRVFSGDMWYAVWFLMVEELRGHEVEIPKYGLQRP